MTPEDKIDKIKAKVICDSYIAGNRITTLHLKFPRIILDEFNTHRAFSRNSSSTRVKSILYLVEKEIDTDIKDVDWSKVIDNIKEYIRYPIWTKTISGMDFGELVRDQDLDKEWENLFIKSVISALYLKKRGIGKQHFNEVLKPFSFVDTIVTSTNWQNMFRQRIQDDVKPEFYYLAKKMKEGIDNSVPTKRYFHAPGVEIKKESEFIGKMLLSAGMLARVTYGNVNQDDLTKAKGVVKKLLSTSNSSFHLSPFEHQAFDYFAYSSYFEPQLKNPNRNFGLGLVQFRAFIEYLFEKNKIDNPLKFNTNIIDKYLNSIEY